MEPEYIYATGIRPRDAAAMQRYREDVEQFLMNYPAGVAS